MAGILETAWNIYSNPYNDLSDVGAYLDEMVASGIISESEARKIFATVVDSIDM